jgi:ABC-type sugar transport system ATPase subunit
MKPHIFKNPSRRANKGIEVVYQDLALCYTLWAAANVFLGQELKRNPSRSTLDDGAARGRAVQGTEIGDARRG